MRRPAVLPTIASLCVATIALGGCAEAQNVSRLSESAPVIGLPCDGCEAVFQGLPDTLSSSARIAPADEPGEPMRIEGTVFTPSGEPAPDVIVYAYHTDATGVYPRDSRSSGAAARHGRLRAWAQTDSLGRYTFETIRPASYPDAPDPAHVHMHIIEINCCTYYIDSIHFRDDPRLSSDAAPPSESGRGGDGVVEPVRDANGVWLVRRDIVLGQGVPGHPGRSS